MEVKKEPTLGDRIKKLRLSFQKPYHFFSMAENGDILIIFENEQGERVFFREKTMVGAIRKAEDYLEVAEIRAGQQKKLEKQKEKKQPQETKSETKENPGIEVKTTIRDPEGNKHKDLD